jgi:hypothetical protein
MFGFDHIKYLIQPTNRKGGWVRVVSVSGTHIADFLTQADAVAWCES